MTIRLYPPVRCRRSPELALHKAIARYLDVALPDDAFWTTIPAGGGGKARGAKLKAMGYKAGTPDIVILSGGDSIWIELKGPRGAASDRQTDVIEQIRRAGGLAYVARSVEDVEDILYNKALINIRVHIT